MGSRIICPHSKDGEGDYNVCIHDMSGSGTIDCNNCAYNTKIKKTSKNIDNDDEQIETFFGIAYKSYCWGYEDSHEGKRMMTLKEYKEHIETLMEAMEDAD